MIDQEYKYCPLRTIADEAHTELRECLGEKCAAYFGGMCQHFETTVEMPKDYRFYLPEKTTKEDSK